MFLTEIVLLATALGLSSGFGLRALKVQQPSPYVVGGVTAAGFIVLMMCFRSLSFGVVRPHMPRYSLISARAD